MDLSQFGTAAFSEGIFSIGALIIAAAMVIAIVGMFIQAVANEGSKVTFVAFAFSGGVAMIGVIAMLVVAPIVAIATFFYTPPVSPVPASNITLSESDGRDAQRFDFVCSRRTGTVEIVGERLRKTFTARSYRFRVERRDISQPADFSIGLRLENKGRKSRLGGQPSWMENVFSSGENIRADGKWQAGYLDRPIILSDGSDYVLRVNLGDGPCPHLIGLR